MLSAYKEKYFGLCIVLIIFIISRLLFLFFTPFSYYTEETKIGSLGHDLIFEGSLKLPFWGYLDSPHSGGSIFSGLFAIPFYLLLGNKYLALKIAALVISLLTVIIWYRLLCAEFKNSNFPIIFFMIFYSFATPHYIQKSVILAGNTVELMFFNALTIYYFWTIRNHEINLKKYLFLGIICGFSFWVQAMSIYLFISIIIILLLTGRSRLEFKAIFILAIGFLIGNLPLWIYNLQYGWPTLIADAKSMPNILFSLDKLGSFLLVDLPTSFHFLDLDKIRSEYFAYIVYVLLITTILVLIRENTKEIKGGQKNVSLEIFLVIYLAVVIFMTTFTSVPIGDRFGWNSMNVHSEYYILYLQPIFFSLFILLNKYKNKLTYSINFAVSLIFILNYVNLFPRPYYNNNLFSPHHSTTANAYECGFHFVRCPKLFFKFKQKVSANLQDSYVKGAIAGLTSTSPDKKDLILKTAKSLGHDYNRLFINK